jgi:hypothetical protein
MTLDGTYREVVCKKLKQIKKLDGKSVFEALLYDHVTYW